MVYNNFCGTGMTGFWGGGWFGWIVPVIFLLMLGVIIWLLWSRNNSSCCEHDYEEISHKKKH